MKIPPSGSPTCFPMPRPNNAVPRSTKQLFLLYCDDIVGVVTNILHI